MIASFRLLNGESPSSKVSPNLLRFRSSGIKTSKSPTTLKEELP